MAASLYATTNVRFEDGTHSRSYAKSYSKTPTGGDYYEGVQAIATTDTALTFDSVTPAFLIFQNVGTTNITVGPNNAGAILGAILLAPGEACGFPVSATSWRAQATGSASKLLVIAMPS